MMQCALLGCTPETPEPPLSVVVPQGPLPDPVELHSVDLSMRIDPRADGFSGEARFHIALGAQRDRLWMHGRDLDVQSIQIRSNDGPPVAATWTQKSHSGTALVTPEQPLPSGNHTIEVAWRAPYARDLAGLFKVEERGHAFVLAKSESIQARRALPSFDEPRFKAPYRVQLTVPTGSTVVGNGSERSRTPIEGGFEVVTLEETAPLPTYLLSLAVGPFESVDGPAIPPSSLRPEAIPIRGHARPGRAGDLGAVLDVTPKLVEILETELGLAFPDPKLDIVAAPAWPSGATELAGAITYREARVLLGPADDGSLDLAARRKMLSTHAHELVHMWFGNLVTPSWWTDLWLKEGFATWGSALALQTLEPDGGHDLVAYQRKLRALRADSLATARSVREPIQSDDDIRNAYDSISYGKGMAIIDMVDHGYGSDQFRSALRSWLESEALHATDTASFIAAINDAEGSSNMGATFSSFLDQPGVPLVQVAVDCPNGHPPSVTLRQQRYRPKGSRIRDGNRWTIPICLATDTLASPLCTVLKGKDTAVELPNSQCPRLIRPNPGGHGYYRFTMSTSRWKAVAHALPSMSAAEALMVVDSASAGFSAQNTPAPVVRVIYEAAARHPARPVITAPFRTLTAWRRHLDPEDQAKLDEWTRSTWADARAKAQVDQTPEGRLLFTEFLAFEALVLKEPSARGQIRSMLEARISGDPQALPASVVDAAMQVVAEDRGTSGLAQMTEQVLQLDDPDLERAILTAPGHLTDPEARKAAFDEVLQGQLDPRVAFARVEALMSTHNPSRQEDIRTRIESNWNPLAEVIPGQWRRRMPALWAGNACTRELAIDLNAWFEGEAAQVAPGHERVLSQTIERIELCAASAWVAKAVGPAFQ